MKKLIVVLFALALGASAQEKKTPPGMPEHARLIQLKYASLPQADRLLQTFSSSPVLIRMANMGSYVSVALSGPPDSVAIIEEFIKKFDVPPPPLKDIEVTAYMLLGTQQADSGDGSPAADLAGVVKQLRAVFGFKSFRLLETMVVRAREGRGAEASGLMSPGDLGVDPSQRPLYQFRFLKSTLASDERGKTVHLENMRFGGRIPVALTSKSGAAEYQYIDTGINTDVDLREGQKVVVGKASIGAANTSLFLVLSAKVVD